MGMTIDADELLKAMDTWDKFGNNPNVGLIVLRTPVLQDRYVPYVKYDDMVKCVKGMPTVEAISKAEYENRLKADMVAMLTDIQLEIEELDLKDSVPDYQKGAEESREYILDLLQQKIDALKRQTDGK